MNMNVTDSGTAQARKEELLNKIWTDAAYRAQIQENPKAALAEFGNQIADDVEIKFVMDTDRVKYLHIPAAPGEGEISDSDLLNAQGGTTAWCISASPVTITGNPTFVPAPDTLP